MKKMLLLAALLLTAATTLRAREYTVTSPDRRIVVTVATDPVLTWRVERDGERLIDASRIALKLTGEEPFGERCAVRRVTRRAVDQRMTAEVPTKFREVRDRCNELLISFRGDWAVRLRVYDNGAAYRFETSRKGNVEIERECAEFRFAEGSETLWPRETTPDFVSHCEASFIREPVTEAVITVPAYFNDAQRQATKDAGKIAGLDVKRIINEPTAAALAYGVDKEQAQKIMVYDLGGGTFDVSILEIDDGVIEVLATAGNNRLGGDDFDQCIMKYLVSEFKKSDGIDLSGDKVAMQRLKEAAEKAKIELSGVTTSNINLPYITADATGPKHLDVTLTRAKFNELTGHLVEATMGPVRQAMSDAGLKPSDLAKVLMVGGSSRIPAVVEAVKNFTGNEPFKGINPDECVAMGAALQAGVLTGDVKGLLLLDVTPLSLGIETMGGVCTRLIERNTTIPVKKSQIFSTAADNQTSVEVNVLQGEREMAAANKSLGRFHLDGIAPARRGVPQIEVTFDIDANGIVNVSAKDLGTGNAQHITITSSSNMSKEDIEKAVKEAEQYAAEDAKIKEKVEVRNQADQMVYQAEKTLNEVGDKVPESEKEPIRAGVEKLKETLKGEDTDAIKAATEELTQLFYKMSEKLYQQQAPQGDPNMGGQQPGGDPNGGQQYYDADYKVVDDDDQNNK